MISLVDELTDDNFSRSEVLEFLIDLKRAGLLVSELKVGIHDVEIEKKVLEILKRNPVLVNRPWFEHIEKLLNLTNRVNSTDQVVELQKYAEDLLRNAGITLTEKNILKIDTLIGRKEFTISTNLQKRLTEALSVLNKISIYRQNYSLEDFKSRFVERFEDKFVPISLAIDPEYGVGYFDGNQRDQNDPRLLKGLNFPTVNQNESFSWDPIQNLFYKNI
ncbi:lantibiotic dehydratase [Olivibacter sp. 47]|nr:lantibiotic dehydratase [Olivibacter sp. 47]MDM8173649.1 lantibiotic dehydratase [Olivibacter sp. 47]